MRLGGRGLHDGDRQPDRGARGGPREPDALARPGGRRRPSVRDAALRRVEVRDGDYGDLAGASVLLITASVNEKAGGATNRKDPAGRLRLLEGNARA